MPENEKKNGLLSIFNGVFKNKKEECADIVTQAETVISDYICKRRNEIINKYCHKNTYLPIAVVAGISAIFLYALYILLV